MYQSLKYPRELTSLALLVSDRKLFQNMTASVTSRFESLGYQSVKLFFLDASYEINDRAGRMNVFIQSERRSRLARLRNHLLIRALADEDCVLWVDADVVFIPPEALDRMVKSKKDIIALRSDLQGVPGREFDRNSWVGPRKKPSEAEFRMIEQGGTFIPDKTPQTKYLTDLAREDPAEFARLDSVGGTVLFLKADIHREGVIFPTQYIVGTGWDHAGYDAIETEGVCYLAKHLGFECWGMPHMVSIHAEC
eukprot:TRINITY_DN5164_c0_g1_i1.p1 TRINITY_DN5164_c0_g1~~TRINITY_DN5164_c0_g1_i1.p1  ORF type:complete len:251 (-),score=43.42 TRINITY_DN5164_c0_g1_i1:68-820(-)